LRISRVKINNFANFQALDVSTGDSLVLVGENKVGKSNFIRALQLILDPGLSERDRQLTLDQFWDGLGTGKLGAIVEVAIELIGFDDKPRLMAHLAECIVSVGPPLVARLTYRYQPKTNLGRQPLSVADYEYILFGGEDPESSLPGDLRRMLPIEVQGALRDAEKDLATWRRSPLRPLIEQLTSELDPTAGANLQTLIDTTQATLAGDAEVVAVANRITDRLIALAGPQHAVSISLGLAPTQLDTLLKALRLLIDGGSRGIGDASVGTANLIFLTLKSLELDRLIQEGERDHTFFAVEEPEAHLHPHVQRLVYRYFLQDTGIEAEDSRANLTTVVTTHSPHIASVAPIRSVLLLREDGTTHATVAKSAAHASLSVTDQRDLQRYIDVTRGEIYFARGVVLVEGDAELFLVPAFAETLGMPLDVLGISVCSVNGTNFTPYAKLIGPSGLDIPFVILTDFDTNGTRPPLCRRRLISILSVLEPTVDHAEHDAAEVIGAAAPHGVHVNGSTLEVELFSSGLGAAMFAVLQAELSLSEATKTKVQGWIDEPTTLDTDNLISLIERVGKGRFAQRLAPHLTAAACPNYMRVALETIRDAVS
jgi:putative ATP-dependent endonuclease of the OLD family